MPQTEPQLTLNLAMHSALIQRIDLDAEGRYLLTASTDKTAKLWDLRRGALLRTFRVPIGPGNEGMLYAGALSPDGQTVALGGWTGYAWEKEISIYLLDASSGRMQRRLSGLGNVINDLEYSPDGRYLAAALGGTQGIRIYRSADGQLLAEDRAYGDGSYNLAWDGRGRLATVCLDGYLRLYDADFHLRHKVKPSGGEQPYSLAFSPDGARLAVGFEDSLRLQVLDGESLRLLYEPDISGAEEVKDRLNRVIFTPDGRSLAAGGFKQIRIWSQAGRGRYRDVPSAGSTIMDLKVGPEGELVLGGSQPDWGRIDPQAGQRRFYQGPELPSYRAKDRTHFRLSASGEELGVKPFGQAALSFSLPSRRRREAESPHPHFRDEGKGLRVSAWEDTYAPRLNGQALDILETYETSRSVDIAQGQVVLGADWYLYGLDRAGQRQWQTPVPGVAWAVKIAAQRPVVAAALGDGTIRWYRLRDGEPLLSLLLHPDGRWLLWTPSGYYDAAPGAEDLIGWHVNQGLDEAPLYHPASKFRDTYHRPDVIDLILETLDEAEALRQADAAAQSRIVQRNIVQSLPPEVNILSPAMGTRVRTRQVTVTYQIESPNDEAITSLRISVDGRPVSTQRGFTTPSDAPRTVQVDIPAEDCVVSIQASNRHGSSTPATLRLSWAGAAPRPVDTRPSLYVLAIGVSNYQHGDIDDLSFAAQDAQDFTAAVQRFEGGLYKRVSVKLLTEAQASKDDILDALEWLQKQPTSRDVAMLFFAGHGVDDNAANFFYLPHDAEPERLRRTGLSKEDVQITIRSVPSKILVFMDACHSGSVGRVDGLARRDLGPDINAVVNELIDAENGAVVFTSSTTRQYSLEDPKWGNGAFTEAILEGLAGAAISGDTRKITVKSLDAYVAERVKQLTNGDQAPTTAYPPNVPDFPIGVVK